MIPKFRAWFDSEMYDMPIVCDGDLYLDYSDFLNGDTCNDAIVMQSTGLFDINDKEIFEGDIVRISIKIGKRWTTTIGAIEFDKSEVCYSKIRIRNELGVYYVTMFNARFFEVIGNIYENPELLEGVEDDTEV